MKAILATLRQTEAMPEADAFGIEMAEGGKVMARPTPPRAASLPGEARTEVHRHLTPALP